MKRVTVVLFAVAMCGILAANSAAQSGQTGRQGGQSGQTGRQGGQSGQTGRGGSSQGNEERRKEQEQKRKEQEKLRQEVRQLQQEVKQHEEALRRARQAEDKDAAQHEMQEIKRLRDRITEIEARAKQGKS